MKDWGVTISGNDMEIALSLVSMTDEEIAVEAEGKNVIFLLGW
jgi:hypothetical protein